MADIKWSAFATAVSPTSGDTLVGLHSGDNVRFTGLTVPFSPTVGGTGVANLIGSTITLGGAFAMSGAFGFTGTLTGATAVTFPTSGTLATTATASGIVNAGSINQLAWYAANGSTVSGLATANNGVLVTSAGGVPSISSTLPSGIAATNMSLTTPTLGVASATSLAFISTSGIIGTTTNDNAAAGSVGEFISSVITDGAPVTINTPSTPQNLTSISLTAGDWDVWGNYVFLTIPAGVSGISAGISTTTNTPPETAKQTNLTVSGIGIYFGAVVPYQRFSLSGTTTIYLVVSANGGAGSSTCCGTLNARRAR